MGHRSLSRALRRLRLPAAALVAALALPAIAGAEGGLAEPGQIEGTVTKAAGGAPLAGIEVCAFDVAEEEAFRECTETKADGSYEVPGLGEGPYRVHFIPSQQTGLAGQYYRGVATPQAAMKVWVTERHASTGINAALQPDADGDDYGDLTQDACPQSAAFHASCPTVAFAPGYTVTSGSIEVKVRSSATTPVAVSADPPGPGTLVAKKTVARKQPATFALTIPPDLRERLERLDATESLTLRLRAHATKVEGALSSDHLAVRLPGRG